MSSEVSTGIGNTTEEGYPAINLSDFGYINLRPSINDLLIVEDDFSTSNLIKTAARKAYDFIRIKSFSTADDALWYMQYLKRNDQPGPDLAIIDIFLKGDKDGFSVCDLISQEFPETTVVVTSSMHPETFQERSQLLPAPPTFLSKPFRLKDLVKLFKNLSQST
jgi:DNA-binding response OmpR family regulator